MESPCECGIEPPGSISQRVSVTLNWNQLSRNKTHILDSHTGVHGILLYANHYCNNYQMIVCGRLKIYKLPQCGHDFHLNLYMYRSDNVPLLLNNEHRTVCMYNSTPIKNRTSLRDILHPEVKFRIIFNCKKKGAREGK